MMAPKLQIIDLKDGQGVLVEADRRRVAGR
ncbi:DUF2800 domain-containing protein [Gleimia hominis]|nr:DUF2800 domain-containing protein [Gleimia hominis]WIK64732.1 DUF2800 domain-containing protein [Gleimia hominis]